MHFNPTTRLWKKHNSSKRSASMKANSASWSALMVSVGLQAQPDKKWAAEAALSLGRNNECQIVDKIINTPLLKQGSCQTVAILWNQKKDHRRFGYTVAQFRRVYHPRLREKQGWLNPPASMRKRKIQVWIVTHWTDSQLPCQNQRKHWPKAKYEICIPSTMKISFLNFKSANLRSDVFVAMIRNTKRGFNRISGVEA